MFQFDAKAMVFQGPAGKLSVGPDDEITRKLLMLIEGQCGGLGPTRAARKYGYCKQRYFQILHAYKSQGAAALASRKRGPKTNYRRTGEVVRQVIRHRFLDPDASLEVIAQKLCQCGFSISKRSVSRVIQEYGLQKKTPSGMPAARAPGRR
jgi:hypothetical protein